MESKTKNSVNNITKFLAKSINYISISETTGLMISLFITMCSLYFSFSSNVFLKSAQKGLGYMNGNITQLYRHK